MNKSLIQITKLRLENDQYVSRSCLINASKIVAVQSGELAKTGAHIIGDERKRVLQMIMIEGGLRIFTESSIDDILRMVGQGSSPAV